MDNNQKTQASREEDRLTRILDTRLREDLFPFLLEEDSSSVPPESKATDFYALARTAVPGFSFRLPAIAASCTGVLILLFAVLFPILHPLRPATTRPEPEPAPFSITRLVTTKESQVFLPSDLTTEEMCRVLPTLLLTPELVGLQSGHHLLEVLTTPDEPASVTNPDQTRVPDRTVPDYRYRS